jgi:hypothetical protein
MTMAYTGRAGPRLLKQDDMELRQWFDMVSSAAAAFEARWTRATLKRVDPSLAERLSEQRDLFDAAMVKGTYTEIAKQGAAMCRGYAAACGALERAEAPDDAYMLGTDPETGMTVAVGLQKASADHVAEVHHAIWITPDEVAMLLASAPFSAMTSVKRLFPGAELTKFKTNEQGT